MPRSSGARAISDPLLECEVRRPMTLELRIHCPAKEKTKFTTFVYRIVPVEESP